MGEIKVGIDARRLLHGHTGLGNYLLWALSRIRDKGKNSPFKFILYTHAPVPRDHWLREHFQIKQALLKFIHNSVWIHLEPPLRVKLDGIDAFWAPAQMFPLFLPSKLKKFLTVHDLIPIVKPHLNQPSYRKYMQFMLRHSLNKADAVMTVSYASKEDIAVAGGFPSERIFVAYPPVPETFHPIDPVEAYEVIERELNLKVKRYFLFVGRFEPRKNLHGILRAMALLKAKGALNFHLIAVGNRGWRSDEIFALISQQNLESYVHLMSGISGKSLNALYNLALALVLPSYYEGFGLPIAEAIYAGTPVITSNVSACPEVAGDAGLKVPPDDVHQIADALYQLSTDEQLAKKLKNATKPQKERLQKEAARFLDVFFQVLNFIFE